MIGAHAEGFNTGTTGIALIGNYSSAVPPLAQQNALAKLLAWRLDVAHVDPRSTVVYTSGGNAKFRAGKVVTLRAISGHRDTGPSECPGERAYALLPGLAQRVALIGLPKLYSPTVLGSLGGPSGSRRGSPRRSRGRSPSSTAPASRSPRRRPGPRVDWTWASPVGARAATRGRSMRRDPGRDRTLGASRRCHHDRPSPSR